MKYRPFVFFRQNKFLQRGKRTRLDGVAMKHIFLTHSFEPVDKIKRALYHSSMNIEQQDKNQVLVPLFKALADETRLNIVRTLRDTTGELSCGDIGERMNIAKSTASYHFRTLREAGLISTRKDVRTKYVSLRRDVFDACLPGFLDSL